MRNNVYSYQMQCINKVQQWFFNSFNNGNMLQKHVIREDGKLFQVFEYFAFGFLSICNIVVYGIL